MADAQSCQFPRVVVDFKKTKLIWSTEVQALVNSQKPYQHPGATGEKAHSESDPNAGLYEEFFEQFGKPPSEPDALITQ
jgi:hypothetical protein